MLWQSSSCRCWTTPHQRGCRDEFSTRYTFGGLSPEELRDYFIYDSCQNACSCRHTGKIHQVLRVFWSRAGVRVQRLLPCCTHGGSLSIFGVESRRTFFSADSWERKRQKQDGWLYTFGRSSSFGWKRKDGPRCAIRTPILHDVCSQASSAKAAWSRCVDASPLSKLGDNFRCLLA